MARAPDSLRLAGLTAGEGLQEMVAGALAGLKRHGSAALNPSPEAVHRFRVGTRRLRSILSAFSGTLPERDRRVLSDRLRSVAQRYGRVREWDVFLDETVAPLRRAMPEETTLAELEETAEQERRRAMPPGDTLKSSLAAVESAVEAAAWLRRPPAGLEERWEMPLREHAAALLAERHRRLRKRVKQADLVDQASFHQLRIRMKKLRYPAELLKSLFDDEIAEIYLERVVALQDLMGSMHDAMVARGLLREAAPPDAARHLVEGWTSHLLEACRDRFPGRARAFRRAAPFWEE